MIILIIVIVVIVIVGGAYMFNSKADTKQTATSEDYNTQTYHTKSKPIKLDVNKQTKIEGKKQSSSPASSILGKFLQKDDDTPIDYNVDELIPFYRSSPEPLPLPAQASPAPAPATPSEITQSNVESLIQQANTLPDNEDRKKIIGDLEKQIDMNTIRS